MADFGGFSSGFGGESASKLTHTYTQPLKLIYPNSTLASLAHPVGDQGGFIGSQGPSPQSGKKGSKDRQSITPLTIKQLLSAKQLHPDDAHKVKFDSLVLKPPSEQLMRQPSKRKNSRFGSFLSVHLDASLSTLCNLFRWTAWRSTK